MNEIVKYHNDLNNISLGGLTENQINILFTIFAKIKDKDTKEINFNLDEIIELSGISTTNKEYLETSIFSCFDKIQNLKIRYIDEEESKVQEVIFPKAKINKDRTKLSVRVSKAFAYIFNNLIGNFTRFELAEFVNLDSKYSKSLYRLLKQYRSTGYFKIEWARFIDLMDIPKSYEMCDIERQILKSSIQKLSSEQTLFDQKRTPFENLTYKKLKTKGMGNKITHIEFNFAPQSNDNKTSDKLENKIANELEELKFKQQFYGKKFIKNDKNHICQNLFKKDDNFLLDCEYWTGKEMKKIRLKFNNLETIQNLISDYEKNNQVKERSEIKKMLKI